MMKQTQRYSGLREEIHIKENGDGFKLTEEGENEIKKYFWALGLNIDYSGYNRKKINIKLDKKEYVEPVKDFLEKYNDMKINVLSARTERDYVEIKIKS